MSLKETATIAFSSALAGSTLTRKQDALVELMNYVENNDNINTYSADGMHIVEDIYSIFISYLNESHLAKTYRLTIAIRDLSLEETDEISAMGFDIYSADGLRLAG